MELTDTPTFLLLAGLVFTLIIYEGFRLKAKEQKKWMKYIQQKKDNFLKI